MGVYIIYRAACILYIICIICIIYNIYNILYNIYIYLLESLNPMICKIVTCYYLPWYSALLGYGKDWLAHDNVTEWDIRLWCRRPGVPVRQHYKVATVPIRYPS